MGFDRRGREFHIGGMAKIVEEPELLTPEQREAVRGVLRDLQALPQGTILTMEEIAALVHRLPGRPKSWTSADVIREARGPLPEDDPHFLHDRGR